MVFFFILIGPGLYDAPNLIGTMKTCARYSNAPAYTIAHKADNYKLFISKAHCKVLYKIFIRKLLGKMHLE